MAGRDLLESDALRAYGVFAQHRNFTRAATEVRISQPSLPVDGRKLAVSVRLPATRGRRGVAGSPQVPVAPNRHPPPPPPKAPLSDLDALPLGAPPVGRPHRAALDRALREAGASWHVAAEVDGWDLLVHFA